MQVEGVLHPSFLRVGGNNDLQGKGIGMFLDLQVGGVGNPLHLQVQKHIKHMPLRVSGDADLQGRWVAYPLLPASHITYFLHKNNQLAV